MPVVTLEPVGIFVKTLMAKLLCIEDSKEFQVLIAKALSGYDIDFADTIDSSRSALDKNKFYDLVLLDLGLPDGDGTRFLSEMRLSDSLKNLPVFIISSDSNVLSKITAFSLGADDYICKPFHPMELKARVEAKIRQIKRNVEQQDIISVGKLTLNLTKMHVLLNDATKTRLDLTPIEFKMLSIFVRRPETIFSRNQLIDEIWGNSVYITDRTVDAHISHLRKKILASDLHISTVTGEGYRLLLNS